jgi:hypothetical protein
MIWVGEIFAIKKDRFLQRISFNDYDFTFPQEVVFCKDRPIGYMGKNEIITFNEIGNTARENNIPIASTEFVHGSSKFDKRRIDGNVF